MKSFSFETTTVRASLATWSSVKATPFSSHTGTSSSSLIGRDALEMSVSPAQNFSKPPPVPEVPTETLTPLLSRLNSSPAAAVRGSTVDEPSVTTSPLTEPSSFSAPSDWPPQAASPTVRRRAAGAAAAVVNVCRFTSGATSRVVPRARRTAFSETLTTGT
jgi:hypothetical protein